MRAPMLQDLKYSLRQLGRQPSFTIIAGLTLALGIGVSTALFSVIDAALLRPLPYPNPEELVTLDVKETRADATGFYSPSMEDIRTWRTLDRIIAHAGMGRVSGFEPLIVETATAAASDRRGSLRGLSRDLRHHAHSWPRHSGGRHARWRPCCDLARPRLLAAGIRRRSECAGPCRPHPEPARDDHRRVASRLLFEHRGLAGQPVLERHDRSPRFRHAGDRPAAAGRHARPGAGRPRRRDAALGLHRVGTRVRFAW